MPRRRSSGQPVSRPRAYEPGLNIATPNSVATAPPPTRPAAALELSIPEQARADEADAAEHEQHGDSRKIRPRVRLSGSSASSSAAIGDTRVARRAGERCREGDEHAHYQSEDHRARLDHGAGIGQVGADALEERVERAGHADPGHHPHDEIRPSPMIALEHHPARI